MGNLKNSMLAACFACARRVRVVAEEPDEISLGELFLASALTVDRLLLWPSLMKGPD